MTTSKRPFEIEFTSINEIRMGSPYNDCCLQIVGKINIKLEHAASWQDKFACSEDNKYLVLVQWNFENNNPGFHLTVFNTLTGQSQKSERIMGMVNSLTISDNSILYNKFLYIGKTTDGKLLDNTENVYEFEGF